MHGHLNVKLVIWVLWVVCFYSLGWMRLCLHGRAAANGPIVSSPDGIRMNMNHWWNENWQGKSEILVERRVTLPALKHNSHMDCLGTELCPPRLESGDWSPELCSPQFNIWIAMLRVAVPNMLYDIFLNMARKTKCNVVKMPRDWKYSTKLQ
jgi:hypothetical protein